MKVINLQTELAKLGFHTASELLTHLPSSKNFISDLAAILDDCRQNLQQLPDDIAILHQQMKNIKEINEQYLPILINHVHNILKEVVHPSEELAVIYFEEQEVEEAIVIYQEAIIGQADAQLKLAHFYKSIGRDDWAFDWFQLAAEDENADALYWLGNYYFVGEVVEHDLEKTYFCYKKAAEKGHPDAINNYADMYLRGEYVEKDEARALELFTLAARKGVPEAMYTLGYMYENGVGTEVNLEKAKEWFIQSAHAGDVFAANKLGHEAVEKGDGKEAIYWYQMAAEQGDSYGEYNLGQCYENGIGTAVNLRKAKHWYRRAAMKGDKLAKQRLKEL